MTFGLLLLDKPEGVSSNGALQRVRRLLKADKAGHVGSLDPLATGMLPICLGEATKIAGDVVAGRKRYRFSVLLGSRTATGDREGDVVETLPVPPITPESVTSALGKFAGRSQQIPPMYSALKRDGQPLYKLARAGIEVEREARDIEISEIVLNGIDNAVLSIDVLCSKGTYVRVLAEDIARELGTCGHVVLLRRLFVEPFENERMLTLEDVEYAVSAGQPVPLMAPDRALPGIPAVTLDVAGSLDMTFGRAVRIPDCLEIGRVRIYDSDRRFIGMGEADGSGTVQPRRLFQHATR